MKAVVVPSNREQSMQQWLDAWASVRDWDLTIIVGDMPGAMDLRIPDGMQVVVTCWSHYRALIGDAEWIISRRDSACRCIGFWLAWKHGADWIATCDDDCLPHDLPWFQGHVDAMQNATQWFRTVEDVRPRGLPYFNQGKLDVRLNHGTWCAVPDLDSVHGLANPRSDYVAAAVSRVVPHQQQFTFCGMNAAFHRSALPLMMFAPMGDRQPFRRFDDIWCGSILSRCFRALGWSITSGLPRVKHLRASDPIKNLTAEAAGIAYNERFWETVEAIDVDGSCPEAAILSVADAFQRSADEYLRGYGQRLAIWAELTADSGREAA